MTSNGRTLPLLRDAGPAPARSEGSSPPPSWPLSVVFVLPFGEPREGFFPDALMELCCGQARALGHRAHLLRVYYDGHDEAADEAVRRRIEAYLAERDADLVVVERLFDPKPIVAHVRGREGRRAVLLSWGDGDVVEGVELVVGRTPGTTRAGDTRRSPTPGELVGAFVELLGALARGRDPGEVPGVARLLGDGLHAGAPAAGRPLPRPFQPALDSDVIAPGEPPPITRKYLFGNAGCPFADDPAGAEHYRDLELPSDGTMSRLGCAFCHAGGDYQKRPDDEVVEELVEQASYYQLHLPDLAELVVVDQHAVRYLERLVHRAIERGLRPSRWLFSARADSFVRERSKVRAALGVAREGGHRLEVYLSGFESFSEAELARYNKGVGVAGLCASVDAMRQLAAQWPGVFEYGRAKGHSTILWSPWTSPDDLLETVAVVRRRGLLELFDEIARNRLRLYPDLPIFRAAERDGALETTWTEGDEGEGRLKGYSVERPWRFLDERTRLANGLLRAMRDRLGHATELAQLAAAASFAREARGPTPVPVDTPAREREVLEALEQLIRAMGRVARREGPAPTAARTRAKAALFAGPCNNGCETCSQGDAWARDDEDAIASRVDEARASGLAVVLAGREPTIHPAFLRLVARARGADGRAVGVVTNARRFAYAAFTRAARRAGLSAASVKVFAADRATADAIARDLGAHEQALAGLAGLVGAAASVEIRAPLHADNLADFASYADLAVRANVRQIRVEASLDAIGLARLGEAAAAVGRLALRCAVLGVALDASPLEAGPRAFDSIPTVGPPPAG